MKENQVGPTSTIFGFTWVGWLNILVLQWFFVRLSYGDRWRILKWILPMTGWLSPYVYVTFPAMGAAKNAQPGLRPLPVTWALTASFWYWWDFDMPLLFGSAHNRAWWFGFNLRDTINADELLLSDIREHAQTAREQVAIDVSYWEE